MQLIDSKWSYYRNREAEVLVLISSDYKVKYPWLHGGFTDIKVALTNAPEQTCENSVTKKEEKQLQTNIRQQLQVAIAVLASGEHLAKKHPKFGSPLMYQWHDSYYLGGAHGISGILLYLLKVRHLLSESDLEKIKGTLDFLLGVRYPSGNLPSSIGSKSDKLVQWCHGSPGFTALLIEAAKVFGAPEYTDAAEQSCDVIWERGLLTKGYGICHGAAGNAYSFLQLYQATKDPKQLHRAGFFAEFCLNYGAHGCGDPDRPLSLFEVVLRSILMNLLFGNDADNDVVEISMKALLRRITNSLSSNIITPKLEPKDPSTPHLEEVTQALDTAKKEQEELPVATDYKSEAVESEAESEVLFNEESQISGSRASNQSWTSIRMNSDDEFVDEEEASLVNNNILTMGGGENEEEEIMLDRESSDHSRLSSLSPVAKKRNRVPPNKKEKKKMDVSNELEDSGGMSRLKNVLASETTPAASKGRGKQSKGRRRAHRSPSVEGSISPHPGSRRTLAKLQSPSPSGGKKRKVHVSRVDQFLRPPFIELSRVSSKSPVLLNENSMLRDTSSRESSRPSSVGPDVMSQPPSPPVRKPGPKSRGKRTSNLSAEKLADSNVNMLTAKTLRASNRASGVRPYLVSQPQSPLVRKPGLPRVSSKSPVLLNENSVLIDTNSRASSRASSVGPDVISQPPPGSKSRGKRTANLSFETEKLADSNVNMLTEKTLRASNRATSVGPDLVSQPQSPPKRKPGPKRKGKRNQATLPTNLSSEEEKLADSNVDLEVQKGKQKKKTDVCPSPTSVIGPTPSPELCPKPGSSAKARRYISPTFPDLIRPRSSLEFDSSPIKPGSKIRKEKKLSEAVSPEIPLIPMAKHGQPDAPVTHLVLSQVQDKCKPPHSPSPRKKTNVSGKIVSLPVSSHLPKGRRTKSSSSSPAVIPSRDSASLVAASSPPVKSGPSKKARRQKHPADLPNPPAVPLQTLATGDHSSERTSRKSPCPDTTDTTCKFSDAVASLGAAPSRAGVAYSSVIAASYTLVRRPDSKGKGVRSKAAVDIQLLSLPQGSVTSPMLSSPTTSENESEPQATKAYQAARPVTPTMSLSPRCKGRTKRKVSTLEDIDQTISRVIQGAYHSDSEPESRSSSCDSGLTGRKGLLRPPSTEPPGKRVRTKSVSFDPSVPFVLSPPRTARKPGAVENVGLVINKKDSLPVKDDGLGDPKKDSLPPSFSPSRAGHRVSEALQSFLAVVISTASSEEKLSHIKLFLGAFGESLNDTQVTSIRHLLVAPVPSEMTVEFLTVYLKRELADLTQQHVESIPSAVPASNTVCDPSPLDTMSAGSALTPLKATAEVIDSTPLIPRSTKKAVRSRNLSASSSLSLPNLIEVPPFREVGVPSSDKESGQVSNGKKRGLATKDPGYVLGISQLERVSEDRFAGVDFSRNKNQAHRQDGHPSKPMSVSGSTVIPSVAESTKNEMEFQAGEIVTEVPQIGAVKVRSLADSLFRRARRRSGDSIEFSDTTGQDFATSQVPKNAPVITTLSAVQSEPLTTAAVQGLTTGSMSFARTRSRSRSRSKTPTIQPAVLVSETEVPVKPVAVSGKGFAKKNKVLSPCTNKKRRGSGSEASDSKVCLESDRELVKEEDEAQPAKNERPSQLSLGSSLVRGWDSALDSVGRAELQNNLTSPMEGPSFSAPSVVTSTPLVLRKNENVEVRFVERQLRCYVRLERCNVQLLQRQLVESAKNKQASEVQFVEHDKREAKPVQRAFLDFAVEKYKAKAVGAGRTASPAGETECGLLQIPEKHRDSVASPSRIIASLGCERETPETLREALPECSLHEVSCQTKTRDHRDIVVPNDYRAVVQKSRKEEKHRSSHPESSKDKRRERDRSKDKKRSKSRDRKKKRSLSRECSKDRPKKIEKLKQPSNTVVAKPHDAFGEMLQVSPVYKERILPVITKLVLNGNFKIPKMPSPDVRPCVTIDVISSAENNSVLCPDKAGSDLSKAAVVMSPKEEMSGEPTCSLAINSTTAIRTYTSEPGVQITSKTAQKIMRQDAERKLLEDPTYTPPQAKLELEPLVVSQKTKKEPTIFVPPPPAMISISSEQGTLEMKMPPTPTQSVSETNRIPPAKKIRIIPSQTEHAQETPLTGTGLNCWVVSDVGSTPPGQVSDEHTANKAPDSGTSPLGSASIESPTTLKLTGNLTPAESSPSPPRNLEPANPENSQHLVGPVPLEGASQRVSGLDMTDVRLEIVRPPSRNGEHSDSNTSSSNFIVATSDTDDQQSFCKRGDPYWSSIQSVATSPASQRSDLTADAFKSIVTQDLISEYEGVEDFIYGYDGILGMPALVPGESEQLSQPQVHHTTTSDHQLEWSASTTGPMKEVHPSDSSAHLDRSYPEVKRQPVLIPQNASFHASPRPGTVRSLAKSPGALMGLNTIDDQEYELDYDPEELESYGSDSGNEKEETKEKQQVPERKAQQLPEIFPTVATHKVETAKASEVKPEAVRHRGKIYICFSKLEDGVCPSTDCSFEHDLKKHADRVPNVLLSFLYKNRYVKAYRGWKGGRTQNLLPAWKNFSDVIAAFVHYAPGQPDRSIMFETLQSWTEHLKTLWRDPDVQSAVGEAFYKYVRSEKRCPSGIIFENLIRVMITVENIEWLEYYLSEQDYFPLGHFDHFIDLVEKITKRGDASKLSGILSCLTRMDEGWLTSRVGSTAHRRKVMMKFLQMHPDPPGHVLEICKTLESEVSEPAAPPVSKPTGEARSGPLLPDPELPSDFGEARSGPLLSGTELPIEFLQPAPSEVKDMKTRLQQKGLLVKEEQVKKHANPIAGQLLTSNQVKSLARLNGKSLPEQFSGLLPTPNAQSVLQRQSAQQVGLLPHPVEGRPSSAAVTSAPPLQDVSVRNLTSGSKSSLGLLLLDPEKHRPLLETPPSALLTKVGLAKRTGPPTLNHRESLQAKKQDVSPWQGLANQSKPYPFGAPPVLNRVARTTSSEPEKTPQTPQRVPASEVMSQDKIRRPISFGGHPVPLTPQISQDLPSAPVLLQSRSLVRPAIPDTRPSSSAGTLSLIRPPVLNQGNAGGALPPVPPVPVRPSSSNELAPTRQLAVQRSDSLPLRRMVTRTNPKDGVGRDEPGSVPQLASFQTPPDLGVEGSPSVFCRPRASLPKFGSVDQKICFAVKNRNWRYVADRFSAETCSDLVIAALVKSLVSEANAAEGMSNVFKEMTKDALKSDRIGRLSVSFGLELCRLKQYEEFYQLCCTLRNGGVKYLLESITSPFYRQIDAYGILLEFSLAIVETNRWKSGIMLLDKRLCDPGYANALTSSPRLTAFSKYVAKKAEHLGAALETVQVIEAAAVRGLTSRLPDQDAFIFVSRSDCKESLLEKVLRLDNIYLPKCTQ